MMRPNIGWLVLALVGSGAIALAACGNKSQDSGGPAPAGCTKDTDCKGDRLCVAGQCQDAPAGSGAAAPGATAAPKPSATATAPAATAAPASGFRAVPEEEWKPLIGPRLRKGAVVAHQVFEVDIGPSPKSLFVVTKEDDQYYATVWSGGRGYRTPQLANNGGVGVKIPAVSFFDVDGDGKTDALVMATYSPKGGGATAFENVLLRWNGTALVRMHDKESGITTLESVAAVRAKLKK